MPARPVSPPYAGNVLLIIGVAALLCGLIVLAGGLRGPDGSPAMAAATASHMSNSEVDGGSPRTSSGVEMVPAGTTARTMALGPSVAPAPRSRGEQVTSEVAAALDRSNMRMETARWTADWYRTVMRTSDDTRTYLVMSAAEPRIARWYRTIMEQNDTSGYGAVELSRATIGDLSWYGPRVFRSIEASGVAAAQQVLLSDDLGSMQEEALMAGVAASMTWDDMSGHGVVEANRAMIEPDAHVPMRPSRD